MDAEGERYRLLETVRQYAQERLRELRRGGRARVAASRVLPRAGGSGERRARRPRAGRVARAARPRAREPACGARMVRPCRRRRRARIAARPRDQALHDLSRPAGAAAPRCAGGAGAPGRAGAHARALPRAPRGRPGRRSTWGATPRRRSCSRRASRSRGKSATRRACNGPRGAGRRRDRTRGPRRRAPLSRAGACAAREHQGNKRELAAAINALAQLCRTGGRPRCRRAALREGAGAGARTRRPREHRHRAAQPRDGVDRPWTTDRARAMLLEVLAIADEIGSKPRRPERARSRGRARGRARRLDARRAVLRCGGGADRATGLQARSRRRGIPRAADARARAKRSAPPRSPPPKRPAARCGYDEAIADARAWLATTGAVKCRRRMRHLDGARVRIVGDGTSAHSHESSRIVVRRRCRVSCSRRADRGVIAVRRSLERTVVGLVHSIVDSDRRMAKTLPATVATVAAELVGRWRGLAYPQAIR